MIKVSLISENDIAAVTALEKEIFSDAWSEKSIRETYEQSHALIIGAWEEETLTGYVIFYYVLDEGEIARIAVAPQCRRKGVAARLFTGVLKECEKKEITKIMLDVRISNEPAIAFYKKHGFIEDGIRKGFYEQPKEDALLMSKEIDRYLP